MRSCTQTALDSQLNGRNRSYTNRSVIPWVIRVSALYVPRPVLVACSATTARRQPRGSHFNNVYKTSRPGLGFLHSLFANMFAEHSIPGRNHYRHRAECLGQAGQSYERL